MFRSITLVFVLSVSAGCPTHRLVLYPNEHLKRVGGSVAERDSNDCLRHAEEYVASHGRVDIAVKEAATGPPLGGRSTPSPAQRVERSSVMRAPERRSVARKGRPGA